MVLDLSGPVCAGGRCADTGEFDSAYRWQGYR